MKRAIVALWVDSLTSDEAMRQAWELADEWDAMWLIVTSLNKRALGAYSNNPPTLIDTTLVPEVEDAFDSEDAVHALIDLVIDDAPVPGLVWITPGIDAETEELLRLNVKPTEVLVITTGPDGAMTDEQSTRVTEHLMEWDDWRNGPRADTLAGTPGYPVIAVVSSDAVFLLIDGLAAQVTTLRDVPDRLAIPVEDWNDVWRIRVQRPGHPGWLLSVPEDDEIEEGIEWITEALTAVQKSDQVVIDADDEPHVAEVQFVFTGRIAQPGEGIDDGSSRLILSARRAVLALPDERQVIGERGVMTPLDGGVRRPEPDDIVIILDADPGATS